MEKFYTINEDWEAEDRRRLLAFARDLLNSDYAGHRLTFQLFAQSPPFAHLAAVYRNFDFDGPLDFVQRVGRAVASGCWPSRSEARHEAHPDPAVQHARHLSRAEPRQRPLPGGRAPATRSTCAARSARTSTRASRSAIGDVEAQAEQAMANIAMLLDEAGGELEDIFKVVVYLTDIRYREPVYRVMGRWLKGVFPVSTGLVVTALARPEWVVEIDATAVISGAAQ